MIWHVVPVSTDTSADVPNPIDSPTSEVANVSTDGLPCGTRAHARASDVCTGAPAPGVVSSISSLLLGFALLVMGNGLLGTLTALRMVHANFPSMTVGFVQAAYYAGFMLGAWRGGSLIARIGHHRAFAIFAAVAT